MKNNNFLKKYFQDILATWRQGDALAEDKDQVYKNCVLRFVRFVFE